MATKLEEFWEEKERSEKSCQLDAEGARDRRIMLIKVPPHDRASKEIKIN